MGTVTDDFNRADGALGSNWDSSTATDAQPAIASNKCVGVGALSGSGRTAETFDNDHSSAFAVPGSLASGHWVGVSVRRTNHGSECYLGIYFFSDPSYVLQLYKRVGGSFTQLGSTFGLGTSPLAAGTILKLGVVGTTLDLSLDGVSKINLTDSTFGSGGHPGILFAGGSDPVDNWIATGGQGHPTSQGVVIA